MRSTSTTAIVIAAGERPRRDLIDGLKHDVVIAVDGGIAAVRSLGLVPNSVVGDLDSASPADVAWARSEGALVVEFSPEKDATDLELALDHAVDLGAERVIVLGLGGGRSDHLLGNWAVVCAHRPCAVEVLETGARSYIVHDRFERAVGEGRTVSIIPWGGPCVVSTDGLRWPLDQTVMSPVASLGISNEAVAADIVVDVHEGTAIVAIPTDAN
ncbi:MAG: thiamine diphosphokinase [Acidimicrobiales bacterium]